MVENSREGRISCVLKGMPERVKAQAYQTYFFLFKMPSDWDPWSVVLGVILLFPKARTPNLNKTEGNNALNATQIKNRRINSYLKMPRYHYKRISDK